MRHPRIRPQETDTFMHVYNRIAGTAGDFPFGNAEKEQFIRRLKRISELYVIDHLPVTEVSRREPRKSVTVFYATCYD